MGFTLTVSRCLFKAVRLEEMPAPILKLFDGQQSCTAHLKHINTSLNDRIHLRRDPLHRHGIGTHRIRVEVVNILVPVVSQGIQV